VAASGRREAPDAKVSPGRNEACGSAPRRRRGVQFPLSVLLILVAGSGALPAGCSAGGRAAVPVALLPAALRLARLLTSLASRLIPTLIGLARLVLRGFIASDLRAITLGRTALRTVATLVLPLVVLVLISHLELHGCRRAGRVRAAAAANRLPRCNSPCAHHSSAPSLRARPQFAIGQRLKNT